MQALQASLDTQAAELAKAKDTAAAAQRDASAAGSDAPQARSKAEVRLIAKLKDAQVSDPVDDPTRFRDGSEMKTITESSVQHAGHPHPLPLQLLLLPFGEMSSDWMHDSEALVASMTGHAVHASMPPHDETLLALTFAVADPGPDFEIDSKARLDLDHLPCRRQWRSGRRRWRRSGRHGAPPRQRLLRLTLRALPTAACAAPPSARSEPTAHQSQRLRLPVLCR